MDTQLVDTVAPNFRTGTAHFEQPPDLDHQKMAQSKKDRTDSAILYVMGKGEFCGKSLDQLAEDSGYCRRTVITSLKRLEAKGFIEDWGKDFGGTKTYRVLTNAGESPIDVSSFVKDSNSAIATPLDEHTYMFSMQIGRTERNKDDTSGEDAIALLRKPRADVSRFIRRTR